MWKWTSGNYFSLINLHEQVTPSGLNPFIFFSTKLNIWKQKLMSSFYIGMDKWNHFTPINILKQVPLIALNLFIFPHKSKYLEAKVVNKSCGYWYLFSSFADNYLHHVLCEGLGSPFHRGILQVLWWGGGTNQLAGIHSWGRGLALGLITFVVFHLYTCYGKLFNYHLKPLYP